MSHFELKGPTECPNKFRIGISQKIFYSTKSKKQCLTPFHLTIFFTKNIQIQTSDDTFFSEFQTLCPIFIYLCTELG